MSSSCYNSSTWIVEMIQCFCVLKTKSTIRRKKCFTKKCFVQYNNTCFITLWDKIRLTKRLNDKNSKEISYCKQPLQTLIRQIGNSVVYNLICSEITIISKRVKWVGDAGYLLARLGWGTSKGNLDLPKSTKTFTVRLKLIHRPLPNRSKLLISFWNLPNVFSYIQVSLAIAGLGFIRNTIFMLNILTIPLLLAVFSHFVSHEES